MVKTKRVESPFDKKCHYTRVKFNEIKKWLLIKLTKNVMSLHVVFCVETLDTLYATCGYGKVIDI